jgi:hypothetical protein
MATMADLDELALAMPQTTKELSDDGRPTYLVHGKFFSSIAAAAEMQSIQVQANDSTTCLSSVSPISE